MRDELLKNLDWYRVNWNNTCFFDQESGEEDLKAAAAEAVPKQSSYGMASFTGPIHLFAMANILQRPIVLFGDPSEGCFTTYAGVYLPLRVGPAAPPRPPVFVAWANGAKNHFCAISPTNETGSLAEPVVVDRMALPLTTEGTVMVYGVDGEMNNLTEAACEPFLVGGQWVINGEQWTGANAMIEQIEAHWREANKGKMLEDEVGTMGDVGLV